MDHPCPQRAAAGQLLLAALDRAGMQVRACYWRRLRPTRRQWALVVSLVEFGPALEPGLSRLVELCREVSDELPALRPLDLWALTPDEPEPARYARAVARRPRVPWPLPYEGDACLPPALLYRLPPA